MNKPLHILFSIFLVIASCIVKLTEHNPQLDRELALDSTSIVKSSTHVTSEYLAHDGQGLSKSIERQVLAKELKAADAATHVMVGADHSSDSEAFVRYKSDPVSERFVIAPRTEKQFIALYGVNGGWSQQQAKQVTDEILYLQTLP